MAFLVMLPTTKLRHMVTSPANMFLSPRERPKGAMQEMPNLMEATDIETIGAIARRRLHLEAALRHRRLHDVRSVHLGVSGQHHRQAARSPRDRAQARRGGRRPLPAIRSRRRSAVDEAITVSADSVFERITSEELWACTTCRACDEICPVNIEILDKILDMRRYLSLMESDFPTELGKAFVALENSSNP